MLRRLQMEMTDSHIPMSDNCSEVCGNSGNCGIAVPKRIVTRRFWYSENKVPRYYDSTVVPPSTSLHTR